MFLLYIEDIAEKTKISLKLYYSLNTNSFTPDQHLASRFKNDEADNLIKIISHIYCNLEIKKITTNYDNLKLASFAK